MSAVKLSKDYCIIWENEFKIITQVQKHVLYHNVCLWIKRNNTQFNIVMGSFNPEQPSELIAVLLLS